MSKYHKFLRKYVDVSMIKMDKFNNETKILF